MGAILQTRELAGVVEYVGHHSQKFPKKNLINPPKKIL